MGDLLRSVVAGLAIASIAVAVGVAVGAWWTENDWVQVGAMGAATLAAAFALAGEGAE